MKKIFSVLTLLTLIIFATPAQAQTDFNFGGKIIPYTTGTIWEAVVVNDIDFLALRSGPSKNYRELLRIPPGARIEVIYGGMSPAEEFAGMDVNPNFVKVRYNGVTGFSHSKYIIRIRIAGEIP